MKPVRLLVVVLVALFAVVGTALAANRNYAVHLSGDEEVPVRLTGAQGQAIFHLSKDGSALEYKLITANIDNVFMAHIHVGPAGSNGPIVAWLAPSSAPPPTAPLHAGRFSGVLAEGTITAANLTGPLAGQPLSALIAVMQAGGAYVNVHTNDFVNPPNTGPGDFPGGEVRGQFSSSGE